MALGTSGTVPGARRVHELAPAEIRDVAKILLDQLVTTSKEEISSCR